MSQPACLSEGYDGTSIEAVLAESGASRGSLYHHFKGKEALFLAVMEDVGARATRPGPRWPRRLTRLRPCGRLPGLDPAGR